MVVPDLSAVLPTLKEWETTGPLRLELGLLLPTLSKSEVPSRTPSIRAQVERLVVSLLLATCLEL